jgi:hypothetical protein
MYIGMLNELQIWLVNVRREMVISPKKKKDKPHQKCAAVQLAFLGWTLDAGTDSPVPIATIMQMNIEMQMNDIP